MWLIIWAIFFLAIKIYYIHSNLSVPHAICWPHIIKRKFAERHEFRRNVNENFITSHSVTSRKKYGTIWIVKLKTPKYAATRRSIAIPFGQRVWKPQERKPKIDRKIKTNQRIYIYVYDYERHKNVFVWKWRMAKMERDLTGRKKKQHIFILSLARSFIFFSISLLFRHKILMQKPQCAACSEGNVEIGTAKQKKN